MTKATYEVVILEIRTMRVIDGVGPTFIEQEDALKWLRQSLKLAEGSEYRIRKTTVELVPASSVDTNCPYCRGLGYDASGYTCTCIGEKK